MDDPTGASPGVTLKERDAIRRALAEYELLGRYFHDETELRAVADRFGSTPKPPGQ